MTGKGDLVSLQGDSLLESAPPISSHNVYHIGHTSQLKPPRYGRRVREPFIGKSPPHSPQSFSPITGGDPQQPMPSPCRRKRAVRAETEQQGAHWWEHRPRQWDTPEPALASTQSNFIKKFPTLGTASIRSVTRWGSEARWGSVL